MTSPEHPRDRAVESALAAAFPHRDVDVVSPGGISWNDQNETVRVEFDDGDAAYLKVAVEGDGSRIVRERAVVEYVDDRCDVAVPTVVANDASASPPHLATAPMDEENLAERWADADTERRVSEARSVGAAVAEIHSQPFESHGHVVGGGEDELRLENGSWTDVLLDVIESSRERASSDRFDAYFDEVAAAVEAHRDELDDAPAALLHGDPAQPNLFYGDATVGFVDWELAHVGDPLRERNRVEHQMLGNEDAEVVSAFRAGYRERLGSEPTRSESRTAIYDGIWHLDVLSAFEEEARRAKVPAAELAATREAEMERLLAEIRPDAMTEDEPPEPDEPYCARRADNEARWSFVRHHVEPEHDSLLDLGCAEGYFTNAAAAAGLEATGIEVDESRYEYAVATYGSEDGVHFERRRITPESVAELPAADVALVLTVQHHWVDAFGVEAATEMLRTVAAKTSLLCYEPPGTTFLGDPDEPIDPAESVARYTEYLDDALDDGAAIRDAATFPHVNEGEWTDRSDPLFAIETEGVEA